MQHRYCNAGTVSSTSSVRYRIGKTILAGPHPFYIAMSARFGSGVGWKFYVLVYFFIVLWSFTTSLKLLMDMILHPFLFFKRTKRLTPPDCMLDPTLGEHKYVQANGLKFHYVTLGDASKPLMLLLHGFPEVRWVPFNAHNLSSACASKATVVVGIYGATSNYTLQQAFLAIRIVLSACIEVPHTLTPTHCFWRHKSTNYGS